VHAGLYGVKNLGSFYLVGVAEYAHFNNETERFIQWVAQDERANGSFSSDEFGARLEVGWKRSLEGYNVTPFVGLDASQLSNDTFAERSGSLTARPAMLGLTFGSNTLTSITSSLGVQLDTRIAFSDGQILEPFGRVAWVHEFNPDRDFNASLTSSPTVWFSPQGAFVGSDAAKVDAGVQLHVTRNMGLFVFFDGEFAGQSQSYAGNAGAKILW
jgi:outer membrane autotransporter protein